MIRGRVLHLDFETCNEADLRKVGADVYSRHPALIVTVVAWAFDEDPVQSVTCPATLPFEIERHLADGGGFKAWNAAFEWAILTNHYGLQLQPGQASCTMQQGLHSGLPGALGDAGPAIGANIVKDTTAHKLMLQMSRPRRMNADGTRTYWHLDDPARLRALQTYCERDVDSERGIAKLIAPLPPVESNVAALDRKANNKGVRLDLKLVRALKALAQAEIGTLNAECERLTQGAVTSPGTQIARLLAWLKGNGLPAESLGKDEVALWLNPNAFNLTLAREDKTVWRVLQIRHEIAKSSLKKLDAMERCAGPDDRVRGQLAYYGAFRTGRFAGRLIQPQNFPRPSIRDVRGFIADALDGCSAEWVRLVYGPPLDAIASALRGCLIPAPGHAFVIYDLSQIEARVVAWLAGQQDVLDVFASGKDIYTHAAAQIGSASRLLGKVLTLACIAEDVLVLTNRGWIPIQNVQTNDLLWDGLEWVSHRGLVKRGLRETIELDGSRLTPDHLVLCGGTWTPAGALAQSAALRSHALATAATTCSTGAPSKLSKHASANSNSKTRTYDLAFAGPRNRFTIWTAAGPLITHNCGFGMGPAKFQATAATYGLLLALEEAEQSVWGWRRNNPMTVNLWWDMDRAVKELLAGFKGVTTSLKVNAKLSLTVSRSKTGRTLLTMLLPSGRRLYYRDARLVFDPVKERDEIVYSGVDPISKRWTDIRTYGGKLIENATQAVARDIIIEAALRIDARRLGDLVMSVHDELVFETPASDAALRAKAIESEVNARPSWAKDLPVASDGGVRLRYGK